VTVVVRRLAQGCRSLLPVSLSSKGETVVVLGELEDSKKTANEQLTRWPENE